MVFFRLESGREPVRDWLKRLPREQCRTVGEDIKTLQFGWPVGMPLARKLAGDLWEVRSNLGPGIARVIFTLHEGRIVLLHGFVKKTRKTPPRELATAWQRLTTLRS